MIMRLSWFIAVVFVVVAPSGAIADPASDAKRHFTRAMAFHKRGDFDSALKELTAAYADEPTPALLYGIAQTHVKLGQCAEATTFYQRFIDTKPSQDAIDHALAAIEACKTSAPSPLTAKEHFARATAFHKQGDYAGALKELTSAYDAEPTPSLLYAIAQTYVKLGQCPEAVTFYRRFIDTKPKQEAIDRALAAIEACKATAPAVAVAPATPVAQPSADKAKKVVLRTDPVTVHPEVPPESKPEAKPAASLPVVQKPTEPQPELVRVDMEDRYDRHPTRKWAYVGAGIGAGALLVGTIFGAAANSAQKSFDDAGCGDRDQVLGGAAISRCLDYERRGSRNVRLGNGFLIGGGGAFAVFAVLLVLDPGNIEHPKLGLPKLGRATVNLSPSSVQLSIPW
jgi:tetratricopeptide (TPR) repeat protein